MPRALTSAHRSAVDPSRVARTGLLDPQRLREIRAGATADASRDVWPIGSRLRQDQP